MYYQQYQMVRRPWGWNYTTQGLYKQCNNVVFSSSHCCHGKK